MSEKPLALIDIGSNSGRMIVIRLTGEGHLEVLADARAVLRLMRDVGAGGGLSELATANAAETLQGFLAIARNAGAKSIVAVATAAVREASNRDRFIRELRERTGVSVAILEGDEEARLAFLGAVHGLPVANGLLLDIGGGSVEIARFNGRKQTGTWTLPLGALRLSDRFFLADPPRAVEIEALGDYVRSMLVGAGVPELRAGDQVVGTGGTIRSVAKIHRAGRYHAIPRLHGYVLRRGDIAEVSRRVCSRSLARRRAISGLSSDRAESIAGGSLVLVATLEHLGAREMVVSGQGLREGLAFQTLGEGLPPPAEVRQAAVAALAARFRTWDGAAAASRRTLARELSDVLDREASGEMIETLDHAAMLLDIGRSVDYYSRWDHAASMVLASDLSGFSHRGLALIALTIESAGGSRRSYGGLQSLISRDDRRAGERAGVILRLADECARRTEGAPEHRVARRDRRGTVVLCLPAARGWQPGDVGKHFRRVFGRALVIDGGAAGQVPGGVALDLK